MKTKRQNQRFMFNPATRNGLLATVEHIAFVTGDNRNEQHFVPRKGGTFVFFKATPKFKRPTLR